MLRPAPARRHLPAVCRALGRPDLLDDERFQSASAIRKHRTEVIAILDEIVVTRTFDEWAEAFDREGVWWAPAQTPAQVVADPQLIENDGFVDLDGGTLRSVNGPITFSDAGRRDDVSVPALGQHTEEVLAGLGDAPGD